MENGLVNLINHMPEDRYRHGIVCVEYSTDFARRITRTSVPVFEMHRSTVGVWGLRRALYRLFKEQRPALVHSRNMSGLDALAPARLAGCQTVHGEHGWDVDNLHGEAFKPALLRRLHKPLIDHYITVSGDLERFLRDRIGVPGNRISHICNGVNTDQFRPATGSQRDFLPPHFQGQDTLLIGTVGRLQAVKDQTTLLNAFSQLVQEDPENAARLRLVIAGDGPLRAALAQQARDLGIADACHFTGSIDNVAETLQALDLFVLPSLNEGISNTVLEAMATGLPLLVSNVGGNPELVREGDNGSLFEAGDVAGLSELLRRYSSNPELRGRVGQAARQAAVNEFSLHTMVNRYQQVYDQLLSPDSA